MQRFYMPASHPKREADSDQGPRHSAQSTGADSMNHASWPHEGGDASPYPHHNDDIEWMAPEIFSGDFALDANATNQERADMFSPRNSDHHEYSRSDNALQLANIPMGYQDMVPAPFPFNPYHDLTLPNVPFPPQPRHLLPQIITNDLPPQPHGHTRASNTHSPHDPMSGYLYHPSSAGASTPSTAGNSLPRTPAPLPTPAGLSTLHPVGMYSPGSSPYMTHGLHHTPSPSNKSPYLPSPIMPSPSMSPVMSTQAMMSRRPSQSYPGVLDLAARYPDADLLLPQKVYRPNTQSDRRRYVEEVDLEAPIMFFLQHPDGCGINCKEAMSSKFSRLIDRDDAMFINRGPSVSIRINWPGYPPWSRQIPTRDFRSPPMPITRSKLAKNVAKTVLRFLEDKKEKAMEEDVDPRFNVAHVTVDQVELVGLQHVSMGSWQAHLRLRPRTRT